MKWLVVIILLFNFSTGVAQKRDLLSYSASKMFSEYSNLIKDSLKKPLLVIPDRSAWEKDRDDFIKMIENYFLTNDLIISRDEGIHKETQKKRYKSDKYSSPVNTNGNAFQGNPKAAIFLALVIGTITGIYGVLHNEEKQPTPPPGKISPEKLFLDFKAYWSLARNPATQEEFRSYLNAKDHVLASLQIQKRGRSKGN